MTTGKITAVCGVPGSAFPAMKPGVTQNVAIGAASLQSAAVGGIVVRLVATSDCHVLISANPTALATSLFLPAKLPEYFVCAATDKIAVIQDAAAGNLSITPAV